MPGKQRVSTSAARSSLPASSAPSDWRISLLKRVQVKTAAHTDTYHGCFRELVPNERVIEVIGFETSDPAMRGEMTITVELADAASFEPAP